MLCTVVWNSVWDHSCRKTDHQHQHGSNLKWIPIYLPPPPVCVSVCVCTLVLLSLWGPVCVLRHESAHHSAELEWTEDAAAERGGACCFAFVMQADAEAWCDVLSAHRLAQKGLLDIYLARLQAHWWWWRWRWRWRSALTSASLLFSIWAEMSCWAEKLCLICWFASRKLKALKSTIS